ncbi:NAD(P)H-dependent oxidoreductase [Francisellaceae bacterium]|nr:NAD(P)H-dependent oxidoreductase [Francisellaceae bacterium]
MSKILPINGQKTFGHSRGGLNQHFSEIAEEHLNHLNHNVKVTVVSDGYDVDEEIEKWLWADVVIYQMPGWWMGLPWTIKKYMDEVFTGGHGKLYSSDGRTRSDPSKKYGSGGLLQDKKYLLSLTWNAPLEAFDDPDQFFEGLGVDQVYFSVHKAHEFIGMSRLPTFISNNVIKDPKIEEDVENFKAHLEKNL